ncbi:GLPGLI family protein [Chryseobacterium limigenitum]|uniref:GLPGLI family protein n=1 Tax=Chryseobacterium limigenitum TaxID=1612149 RepID=A0A1K2IT30_9FLAO|nr:GLPGLI family protein [Chryseobacterium limigenitum]SFZ95612.1 GLPGLI family protein [Chryseobacterium limigenitum]
MKKVLLFFIIYITNCVQAQEVKSNTVFYYKYTFMRDSLDKDRKFDETMVLLSNGKESIYKSYSKMRRDSIVQSNFEKGNYSINFANMPQARVNHEVYYDEGKNIKLLDKIVNKLYGYPVEKINWKIESEKKKIGEFNCQKATCLLNNRKFIAWFTSDVPINDGPFRFKGLPGLIVEVYDLNHYFTFNLIGVKKQSLPITLPKNFIETTFTNFTKERKDFYADPAGKAKIYMGSNVQLADPKVINEKFKRDNLFLD